MNDQWHYSHAGATYGPFSVEKIKERIRRKNLLESDWVWQGPSGVRVQAVSVFDFSAPAVSGVPDWLADVVEVEDEGLLSRSPDGAERPEWLEDLRLWIALEQYEPGWELFNQAADSPAATSPQAGGMPGWLAGWSVPAAPPKPSMTPPPSRATPASIPAPQSVVPTPVTKAPFAVPPAVKAPAPMTPPTKPPAAPPPATAAQSLADAVREATGFDADTGRIIDPVKFASWKQQQAQPGAAGQPAVSNASLFEVFRKGRTAIEAWVDDEQNRSRILHAEADEIKRQPRIQAIVQEYANFGKGVQEKLLRHLEFMVENRRKYYQALQGRSR